MRSLTVAFHRYNDDEPSASRAPAAPPAQAPPPVAAPVSAPEPAGQDGYGDDAGGQGGGDYDDTMQYDDDDDDVDFNLGNGSSSNNNAGAGASSAAGGGFGGAGQRSEETPLPSGGGHFSAGPRQGPPASKVGPNSKEDGYVYFLCDGDRCVDSSSISPCYRSPLRIFSLRCPGFCTLFIA